MYKKVLLYLPFVSDFYIGLYSQIKYGFESIGCIVDGGCGYLSSTQIKQKIDTFQPDFVFEMNRSKSEIVDFPKDILHICWLVDYWEKTPDDIQGSDILYLFSHVWLKDHTKFDGSLLDVLYPGTDTNIYYPKTQHVESNSVIFVGHMPKVWTEKDLNRDIRLSNHKIIKFKDLVEIVHEFTMNPEDFSDGTIATYKYIIKYLNTQNIDLLQDKVLHYDIFSRLFREGRRLGVINKVIKSNNINIYGNEAWLERKHLSKYYKKFLNTPEELNNAFNKNRYLLHDGNMPHFRTFDAMAAGLLVLKPEVINYGIEDEWQFLDFKEGEEIFTYSLLEDNFSCLDNIDKNHMKDISVAIRDKIKLSHTWTKRAEKILKDVENVLKAK